MVLCVHRVIIIHVYENVKLANIQDKRKSAIQSESECTIHRFVQWILYRLKSEYKNCIDQSSSLGVVVSIIFLFYFTFPFCACIGNVKCSQLFVVAVVVVFSRRIQMYPNLFSKLLKDRFKYQLKKANITFLQKKFQIQGTNINCSDFMKCFWTKIVIRRNNWFIIICIICGCVVIYDDISHNKSSTTII